MIPFCSRYITAIDVHDSISDLDNDSLHPGGLRLTDRAARLSGIQSGMLVADIGCGNASTLQFLKQKYNINAVGLDLSGKAVEHAKKRTHDIEVLCCDAENLPYSQSSLDVVISECTLSQVRRPARVISQMYRSVKPGGRVVISDIYAKKGSGDQWTKIDLLKMISKAGFDIITCEDHTPALITYIAEKSNKQNNALGYILIIAEKPL